MSETELRRQAGEIKRSAPAVLKAVDDAIARLEAPWYVRAYHQARQHQGWGRGEELQLALSAAAFVSLAALACLLWIAR